MDARPTLFRIAKLMQEHGLEAVLIGNAAAALQGAPVTTVDFDFMFRKTAANLRKLKAVARALNATILRPYYPASDLFRMSRDEDGLQIDFMATVDGVRSLASLRSRAELVKYEDTQVLVASLEDVIASKKAAGRPQDLAVMNVLQRALDEKTDHEKRKTRSPKKGK